MTNFDFELEELENIYENPKQKELTNNFWQCLPNVQKKLNGIEIQNASIFDSKKCKIEKMELVCL
jgi:hypothetical protein